MMFLLLIMPVRNSVYLLLSCRRPERAEPPLPWLTACPPFKTQTRSSCSPMADSSSQVPTTSSSTCAATLRCLPPEACEPSPFLAECIWHSLAEQRPALPNLMHSLPLKPWLLSTKRGGQLEGIVAGWNSRRLFKSSRKDDSSIFEVRSRSS